MALTLKDIVSWDPDIIVGLEPAFYKRTDQGSEHLALSPDQIKGLKLRPGQTALLEFKLPTGATISDTMKVTLGKDGNISWGTTK